MSNGGRYALLIANGKCNYKELGDLKSPSNNINDVKEILTNPKLGYFNNAETVFDKNANDIKCSIHDFLKKCKRGDLALIYYSGHGECTEDNTLYFVTNDYEGEDLPKVCFNTNIIFEYIGLYKATYNIVILDCCYSGAFIDKFKNKGNTVIITAASGHEQGFESVTDRNSKFSELFIKGIKTGGETSFYNEKISFNDITEYIKTHISGQKPELLNYIKSETPFVSHNPNWENISRPNIFEVPHKYIENLDIIDMEKKLRDYSKINLEIKTSNGVFTDDFRKFSIFADSENKEFMQNEITKIMVGNERANYVVIGDCGIGKSEFIVELWQHFVLGDETCPILVYIELKDYNKHNKKEFIYFSIMREYGFQTDKDYCLVRNFFKEAYDGTKPKIVLLLDGYSEITGNTDSLIEELNEIERYAGVRIIITSRTNIIKVGKNYKRYNVQGLDRGKVKEVIDNNKWNYDECSEGLKTLLRNPMLLRLYIGISSSNYRSDQYLELKQTLNTEGELIQNYIETLLSRYNTNEEVFLFYDFVVKILLPGIAFHMFEKELAEIDGNELKRLIITKLDETVGNENFRQVDNIESIITEKIVIMKTNGKIFNFANQNFMDYFSAIYVINDIKKCLKFECTPETLKNMVLIEPILRYIGEIEGEYVDKTQKTNNESYIEKLLHLLSGKYSGEMGYAVCNVIKLIKLFNKEYFNYDFSGLDLSKVILNGEVFSRIKSKNIWPLSFKNSIVHEKNLMPQGHSDGVCCVVAKKSIFISGSKDKIIKVWDLYSRECIMVLKGHTDDVLSLAVKENILVSGSKDKTICVWNLDEKRCIETIAAHDKRVTCVDIVGDTIISGSWDGKIKIWNLKTFGCIKTIDAHDGYVNDLKANDKFIVSVSSDKKVKVWDTNTYKCRAAYDEHSYKINCVALDGDKIATGDKKGVIKIFMLMPEQNQCVNTFTGHNGEAVLSLEFRGRILFSSSTDKTIKAWDVYAEKDNCLYTIEGHSKQVNDLAIINGNIISCSSDWTVKVWDLDKPDNTYMISAGLSSVNSVVVHKNLLIAGSQDKSVKVWDLEKKKCVRMFDCLSGAKKVEICDGKIITLSNNGKIDLWDFETGEYIRSFNVETAKDITVDNDKIFYLTESKIIEIIDIINNEYADRFSCDENVKSLTSKNGKIFYYIDKTVYIFNTEEYTTTPIVTEHKSRVTCIAVGKNTVVSGSYDGTIKVWEIGSRELKMMLNDHKSAITSIAVHERLVISGSEDKTIKIQDLKMEKEVLTLAGHSGTVNCLTVAGNRLISGSDDETIRVWDMNSGECKAVLKNVPGLFVNECSFANLHEQSDISNECYEILEMYGAEVQGTDEK